MKVDLIYASTSGNVEIVMETIAEELRKQHLAPVLNRAEKTPLETIKKNGHFVFGTSTWEHGMLNPHFEELYEAMKTENFNNKQAAFVGLGDRRYEPVLFCEGIELVQRLWLKSGGKKIGTILKIQGEPYEQLESLVRPWALQLAEKLKNNRD